MRLFIRLLHSRRCLRYVPIKSHIYSLFLFGKSETHLQWSSTAIYVFAPDTKLQVRSFHRSTKPSPRPTLKTAKKEASYEHSCYASSLVGSPCSRKHQATQRAINVDVFHWFSRVWIKNGGSLEREGGCRAAESILCGCSSPAKVQHFTAYNAVSLHIHISCFKSSARLFVASARL